MRKVLLICLALALAQISVAQTAKKSVPKPAHTISINPQVHDHEFQSKSLGRTMRYRVIVPADYDRATRHYPALYLLHGLYGDFENWETRTNLVQYAEKYQFIIVMPDAGDSWYTNSATVPQNKFEDYIIKDVIDETEKSWRIIRSPHRRAIAGLSMGGYAAIKFALRYPGMFAVAASISGAMNPTSPDMVRLQPSFEPNLSNIYGPLGSETRSQNDVYELARAADPSVVPYLYIDIGNQDWTLASDRELVNILSERKYRYEYHEMPGIHSWEYWDRRVPNVLEIAAQFIGKP
jgi:S-formylglutathione hydrolase FrmB